jgi:hypothetical protein
LESSLGIQLNEGVDQDRISAFLQERYSFALEEPVSEEWVFYDTFDWRLYRKSLVLYLSGRTLTLRSMADGEPLDSLVCERWSSFADGL